MKNLKTFESFINEADTSDDYVVFLDLKENGKGKQEMFRGPKAKASRAAESIWRNYRDGADFEIGIVTAEEWEDIKKKK